MLKLILLTLVSLCIIQSAKSADFPIKALALIQGSGRSALTNETVKLSGQVEFEQFSLEGGVFVRVNLKFDTPTFDRTILRGIHVHEKPIQDNNCETASGHWNPKKVNHGLLTSLVHHAGDLGNFRFTPEGVCISEVRSFDLSLTGDESIINRSVVVHERIDDGGVGIDPSSIKTGNAGAKIACGTIKLIE